MDVNMLLLMCEATLKSWFSPPTCGFHGSNSRHRSWQYVPLPAELSLILNLFLDITSCIPSWVLTPCVAKDDWTSCPSMCTYLCMLAL